jgi:hypothetical protein
LRSSLSLLSAAAIIACSSPAPGWAPVKDVGGDFTVLMPNANDTQRGSLDIAGEEVVSHVAMTADSGVVYLAAWYDLPARFGTSDPMERMEVAWASVRERAGVEIIPGSGPLGADTPEMRNAWYQSPDGNSMGVVLVVRGMRVYLLNTSAHNADVQALMQANIERFFRSFRLE